MLRGGWFRRVDRKVDMADLPEATVSFTEPDDTLTRPFSPYPMVYGM